MTEIPLTTRIVITLGFMALLMVASIIPGRAEPGDSVFIWLVAKTPTLLQKALHICLYAMLTLLWVWTLDAIQSKSQRLIIAVTVAVCFGATMEWYQTKVPGRFGTIFDVGLNAVGALLGLFAAIFLL
ncbi:MAG: VanZ family protein [Gammaproteobacteria bacterium]|nr:VanZ family protein [Gammaproteobacteria bacterium]